MTIWMQEAYKSRDGERGVSGSSFDLIYFTGGESNEVTAEAYVLANTPTTYRDLPLRTCSHTQHTEDLYEWKLNYGASTSGTTPGGPPVLNFQVGGGTIHITNSLANTRYADASLVGSGGIDYKGAIGVELNDDGTKARVRGVEVYASVLDFSYQAEFDNSFVTDSYIAGVYSLSQNPVNNAPFFGREAGTVLFKGARGSKKGLDTWEITFDFSFSPNVTGVTIGAITSINKTGWQYLDVLYVPNGRSATGNFRILTPGQVTVHTVYNSGDFSALGIGTF